MNPVMQLYNTFRNRWCGAYFASKGIPVIPTVSWGDENTFDFCFDGIPKGSTVAVSTYMVSEYNHRKDQKEFFLKGYNEMLARIEPERIICYNKPFPEMRGNIVFVDYELSSWKYQNKDHVPSCGCAVLKQGYVLSAHDEKGMGSAFGGEWKPSPNKPDDQRFLGEPGEIKVTYDSNGEKRETKIGKNGRAEKERHYSVHNNPKHHTNPHDHIIDWESPRYGQPNFIKPSINYPDSVPEFKNFGGIAVKTIVQGNSFEQNRFKTISEFEDSMIRGGEVEFEWKGKRYSTTYTSEIPVQISIVEINREETELLADTVDEVLEYIVSGDRLRDVITQVKVWARTI